MLTKNRVIAALLAIVLALVFAACTDTNKNENVREQEQQAATTGFERLVRSQQIPVFDYSQERQTLIDVLTMRAEGTHGTASAYSLDGTLLWWCPSLGAPVPSTYQLTNPEQVVTPGPRERGTATVGQGEQTGVYTGDSAATWTVCLDDNGTPFGQYEEANVRWTGGIVNGLPADKRARVDEVTFDFTPPEAP